MIRGYSLWRECETHGHQEVPLEKLEDRKMYKAEVTFQVGEGTRVEHFQGRGETIKQEVAEKAEKLKGNVHRVMASPW